MQIWLDTVQKNSILKAKQMGLLSGVTTNPRLIAQSGRLFEDILQELLNCQEGPVTAQVVAEKATDMVEQGQKLYDFSNRLIIKIPSTVQGMEAIHLLSRQGIPTMATMVFQTRQAIMATLAGANYIAPYISRIEEAGENPWKILEEIQLFIKNYHLPVKIIGASLKKCEDVLKCCHLGLSCITINSLVFENLISDDPSTIHCLSLFSQEWKQSINATQGVF